MRRRLRLLLAAVPILAAGLITALYLLWPTSPSARINHAAYERIQLGMSRAEVEAVVGLPPGDYRSAAGSRKGADAEETEALAGLSYPPDAAGPDALDFYGDDGMIWVDVDDEQGVVAKHYGRPRGGLWDLLRDRLGW